ncbi:hypothetical protein M408DRAFT_63396 [Serendipita vermifera MAFF 305830]|uniref:DUF6593 domain-containing protein n=1 Tax=Serendipita vermifera MAFF 305830 TaxID=933852 RepID=A0A0C3BKT2_SERVB|nr:hypothetical protein M408DRAFT_63396 [Serendipita vermifera MAFF 305830]
MSTHLYFANNSIRNTTITCDSLGIHYNVSKTGRIISLSRWDSKNNLDVTVGEFELPFFKKDRIKVGPNGQWQDMRDYFDKSGSFLTSKTFTSNNGMNYTWKEHWGKMIVRSTRIHRARLTDDALIKYHRNMSDSYLEVLDSSTLTDLDTILLAFLITERKRRNKQKQRRSARASGGGP